MREVDRRSKYNRRVFLQGAASAMPAVAVATSAGLGVSDAWAEDATALTPTTLKTLVKVARDIYPHDFLVDNYYIVAVKPWDARRQRTGRQGDDRRRRSPSRSGRARPAQGCLRASALGGRSDRAAAGHRADRFLRKVRSDLVVSLYNQEELWPKLATRAPPPSTAATSSVASTTSIGCRKSEGFEQTRLGGHSWQNSI